MSALATCVIALACGGASCVPSTGDLQPTGAAGFTLEPSAPSRGEPFVTADGWTVTVDQLLVLANVTARPTREEEEEDPESERDQLLFSARSSAPVFVPGVPVGEARLRVYFGKLFLDLALNEDPGTELDVQHFLPRFRQAADLTYDYAAASRAAPPPALGAGPSILVAFHAEEASGRTLRGTLTMATNAGRFVRFPTVMVAANALTTTPLAVHAEALFHALPWCGRPSCATANVPDAVPAPPLLFGPFADADRDGDGVLTGPEAIASNPADSFSNELIERAAGLFTVPPS